jgi:hypothetical protein
MMRAIPFSVRPRESGDPELKELDSRLRGNERESAGAIVGVT